MTQNIPNWVISIPCFCCAHSWWDWRYCCSDISPWIIVASLVKPFVFSSPFAILVCNEWYSLHPSCLHLAYLLMSKLITLKREHLTSPAGLSYSLDKHQWCCCVPPVIFHQPNWLLILKFKLQNKKVQSNGQECCGLLFFYIIFE